MLPTPRDVHVDAELTNIAINYRDQRWIADQVFPVVPVRKQSDLIPAFNQSAWFRDEARIRAPATKSEGGGWTRTTDTYFCHRYSFRTEIPDEVRDNADDNWRLDETGTNLVMRKIFMRKEVAFATDFFTPGVWADDEAGGTDFTQWSDYSTSTPFLDLTTYQDEIEGRVASEANTLVIGKRPWNALRWHPDLIETIKYTQRGIATEELFRTAAGIDRLFIGRALMTSDPEGTAEASVTYARIFGNHALLAYVSSAPSLIDPSAGYTFTWNRVPNSLAYVVRHRDPEREVDIIEGNTYFDQKATVTRAATFLQNVVTA